MGQTSYVVYPARVAIVPGTDHEDLCGSDPKAMAFCIMGAGFLARLAYSQYPEYVPKTHW